MIDANKLALLREVSVHGGVTSAAAALLTTPSNVSQQIRRLERDTGVPLLESRGRGVALTPAGEQLVDRAEAILEILSEAETDLEYHRDTDGGTVRLAGFHTFAVGLLASVVHHLERIAPQVTLEYTQLDPESAVGEVLARRSDIAVVDEYPGFPMAPAAGLVRTVLGEERVDVYLPDGIDDPARVPWAMEPRRSDVAKWATSVCHEVGFAPHTRYVSPDPYVHRQLLEQGIAAAFLPATVSRGLHAGAEPSKLFPTGLARRHALISRRGTLRSPTVAATADAIRAAFAEVVE